MISWLQTILQRHYKWLFSGLLAIIIVAFVFTIGNTGGVGSGNTQDIKLEFFGVNLNSPRQMQALEIDTSLSARLMGRRLNRNTFNSAVLERITALHLANQIGVPGPTEEQIARYIRALPGLRDPQTGQFSRDQYTALLDEIQNSPELGGEQALLNVISDDYRITKVMDALSGPGYVLPYIAKLQLEAMDTTWSIDTATLERNSFKPEVQVSDEQLQTFYKENEFRFATGPRIVVGYVAFPFSEYTRQIEDPKPATLLTYYRANRSKFPMGEDGKPQPIDAVKDEVIQAWKEEQAQELAINEANKLAVAAYEAAYAGKLAPNPKSVTAFAETQGKPLVTLEPFPREQPSTSVPGVPASALALAASLDSNRFYTDGVMLDDKAAVFFLEEELPSTTPALGEIRHDVMSAYISAETRRLFNAHAQQLTKDLKSAVAAGQSFTSKAQELGLTVESFSDFTFASPPQGMDYYLLQTVQGMKAGEVSDLISSGGMGTILYVSKKETPKVELDSQEVQENIQQLASFTSRATAQGILNEMVAQEETRVRPQEF